MTKLIKCGRMKEVEIEARATAITNSADEYIVPLIIMKTGVFNEYLKEAKPLSNSTKWWEGVSIVIKDPESIDDHPDTVIVTNKTTRVGQVRSPRWDVTHERIVAEAHIDMQLCPDWLKDSIMNGDIKGVSGTYFCDLLKETGELDGEKYTHKETNYVPNNVAIVKYPACKPPDCGLNLEINSQKGDRMTETVKKMCKNCGKPIEDCDDEPLTDEQNPEDKKKEGEEPKPEDKKKKKEKVKEPADSNVIVKQSEGEKMAEITIEDLKKQLAEKDLVINSQKEEIGKFKTAEKEAAFLGQFPEESKAAAKAELMPIFMKDPGDLVMNHAKRLGELLSPAGLLDKSVGSEHVDLPLKSVVENAEVKDEVDKALDAVSLNDIRGMMGLPIPAPKKA